MRGGRGETAHIQQRAAADYRQVRMSVQTRIVDGATDGVHMGRNVLHGFAAREQKRGTRQRQRIGMAFEIPFDGGANRAGVFHVPLHHEKHADGTARPAAPGQNDLAEGKIYQGE